MIRALVAFHESRGSLHKLDQLIDDDTVKDRVEADKTLGGVVDDLHVTEVSGEQLYTRGGSTFLGCEWTVRVLVSN